MEINGDTLRAAAEFVDECAQETEIHTVILLVNGQHGGTDVKVLGTTGEDMEPYKRSYQVSR